jgi:DNA-binding beta-propeller fold protein YncE
MAFNRLPERRNGVARGKGSLLAIFGAILAAATLIWLDSSVISARSRIIGADRITAFEALPDPDTELCTMPGMETASMSAAIHAMETLPQPGGDALVCAAPMPVEQTVPTPVEQTLRFASQLTAVSTLAEAQEAGSQGGAPNSGTRYEARTRMGTINRPPARYLKDPYPAFSSIAVNPENDMVVVTDENLFRIVEYSRRDNTPNASTITQPRPVIGGSNTKTEMMCGAYIDPKTLDVYVTNNDTQNWLPVFSREARGNAVPDRMLMTPHRTWGIAADEEKDELYLTVQDPPLVIVYRKSAANNDAPLRTLEGDATQLADPHGIAFDNQRGLMVISNHGHRRFYGGPAVVTLKQPWSEWINRTDDLNSPPRERLLGAGQFDLPSITIFQKGVSGNTAPVRIIKGPKTQLNWPSHVAVHEARGEIFVANDADDAVLVFKVTDNGDIAPTRVIKGSRAQIKNPTGLTVDQRNNELWVTSMGNYTITVFPVAASGNAQPLRTIRGGPPDKVALMIGNPGAVGYDRKRQEILVPN